jgi:glycosyltransferase involved in cell wall biosynthesis
VVIAAYNEGGQIFSVVSDVIREGYRAVVVDDGSDDETARMATTAGAYVVTHPVNLGQGAALQTGIECALLLGAEVVVTFDADGQHRTSDIWNLVQALSVYEADFALGSRFLGGTVGLKLSRRMLLCAALWLTRLTSGLRISDTHNGLRAMTRLGATKIHLSQNRMAHASEILHQIALSRLKYVEVPVVIEYTAYSIKKGQKLYDAIPILSDLILRKLLQ